MITPLGVVYDGTAVLVVAPGAEGQFGVLAGHEHMVAVLKKGVLKIKTAVAENFFSLDSGVLEVDGDHNVVALADKVIKAAGEEDAKAKIAELAVKAA